MFELWHFNRMTIGQAQRPLMAFVMVLSRSRQIFLRFYLDARMATNFLRGHVAAFDAWQGLPWVLLHNNLKSAVLERQGDAIRFYPTLLDFAGHYRFEPLPVAVARGNEKDRVVRAIRYIRENIFLITYVSKLLCSKARSSLDAVGGISVAHPPSRALRHVVRPLVDAARIRRKIIGAWPRKK
jgi:transposase